jgi:hypothetical protein
VRTDGRTNPVLNEYLSDGFAQSRNSSDVKVVFRLVSPGEHSADEIGADFPDVDAAYLDAHKAALDMTCDLLRQRCDPRRYQFEIADCDGRFLMDLPFSEVMPRTQPRMQIHRKLQERIARCRKLRTDLATECRKTRSTLALAQATLARSRTRG